MAQRKKRIVFHKFRYQILPISQHIQMELFDHRLSSLESLKAHKNEIFEEALLSVQEFYFTRAEIIHRILYCRHHLIVLEIGVNRSISRQLKDFSEEILDNWPSILVVINNHPDSQLVAIELDRKVFYRTTTVANILENNLNEILRKKQLQVRFMPTFEKSQFWEIVSRYSDRVIQVEFEMISPNLSNISKSLNLDLAALRDRTNTQETLLRLKSDKESHLTLSPDDAFISSLVAYSAEGGGNVSLKIKGVKRKFKTENSISEIEIRDIEIKSKSAEEIARIFSEILQ